MLGAFNHVKPWVELIGVEDNLAIKLYRALLRECTYLPDPAARTYAHKQVVAQYRKHTHPDSDGNLAKELRRLKVNHIIKARDTLDLLQRANNGHPGPLQKVLHWTYGRTGRRRHELLVPLLQPHIPTDQEDLAKIVATFGHGDPRSPTTPAPIDGEAVESQIPIPTSVMSDATLKTTDHDSPRLPPMLDTLMRSQKRKSIVRPSVRIHKLGSAFEMELKLPEKNAWQRKLPKNRYRNAVKLWYTTMLDRALPPLPKEEWKRLEALVLGKSEWEGPIRRRGQSQLLEDRNAHKITHRYMRRLWASTFELCPSLQWDDKGSKVEVIWPVAPINEPVIGRNLEDLPMDYFFEGVDEKGRTMKTAQAA